MNSPVPGAWWLHKWPGWVALASQHFHWHVGIIPVDSTLYQLSIFSALVKVMFSFKIYYTPKHELPFNGPKCEQFLLHYLDDPLVRWIVKKSINHAEVPFCITSESLVKTFSPNHTSDDLST